MPAAPQSRVKTGGMLGVIAGSGELPERLLSACDQKGQEVFVVGFEGHTDPDVLKGRNHIITRIGAAGQIIETLKSRGIRDLVFIGAIRRPSLAELRPDLRTAQFFARVGLKAFGDDGLLRAMREELEKEGFTIHGIHALVEDILAREGVVGRFKPKKADWLDIMRGLEVSRHLGDVDVGQSVIVQEGLVLGVEAAEGTDELIRRCAAYRRAGRGGVLVKTCKPQQDRDFDLPTIGPNTALLCAENGFSGIVIHAGHSLMIAPQDVAAIADRYKMFVIALDPDNVPDAA